jgi:hypothetical protein
MIRLTLSSLIAAVAMIAFSSSSQAQIYVPHTTTHIDLVPHYGHLDAVPHTTTHFDVIPSHNSHFGSGYGLGYNTGFGSSYSYNSGYGSCYAPQYNSFNYPVYQNSYQHSSTHLDIVPHRGHFHVVPHTTTHGHRF